jgi:hypothetical protein
MASSTAQVSLTGASTGTGLSVDFTVAKKNVSAVIFTSGGVTGGVVQVEASQDNLNWVPIAAYAIDATRTRSFDSSRGAYRYWRATILDPIKGGGAISATFMEAD